MPGCDTCHQHWPMGLLDAKPRFLRRRRLTAIMPIGLFNWLMVWAAKRDMPFDHVEGPCCYGPGFTPEEARDWETRYMPIHRVPEMSEEAEAALKDALDKAVLDGAVYGIGRAVDRITGFAGEDIDPGDVLSRAEGVPPTYRVHIGSRQQGKTAATEDRIQAGRGKFGIPDVIAIDIDTRPGVYRLWRDGKEIGCIPSLSLTDFMGDQPLGEAFDINLSANNASYAVEGIKMAAVHEAKERVYAITYALDDLRDARDNLKEAGGCPKALERVRGAIKSTEGAHRHAQGLLDRLRGKEGQSDAS